MRIAQIPNQVKSGIFQLIKISEHNFEQVISAIKSAPVAFNVNQILLEFQNHLENLDDENVRDIVRAILSFFALRESTNSSIEQISEDLIEAILSDDDFVKEFSDEQLDSFKDRLVKLLEIDTSLKLSTKAVNLLQEYERILLESRIITDIRPLLSTDSDKDVTGALIVHTLKIEYRDADGFKEFYVALDSKDLQNLREQLNKAEETANAIEKMLSKANITYLNPTVES
ncbi:hypothetical protein [Iningainema tapete]|uniref:Uncharacterized protein n=1 Tax=Iningainema tapete BLCC-T55 TaxID=2748662 RepID=A0A8J7CA02_9CYAN|nr:hypothetical protein [Iningainema tapete]MBD2778709.1 hypothetical protein [Iningainema tapete BLCC-T55]